MVASAHAESKTGTNAGAGWVPDRSQELLLGAALLDGGAARSAWERWLAGRQLDSIHVSDRRLLPALYPNLARAGGDVPELARLRGIHRHEWYRNQLLFAAAGRLITLLDGAGIPTMVLNGAALATLHYRDAGSRAMGDVDVLVPPESAATAVAALRQAGWRPGRPTPRDLTSVSHAWRFSDGEGGTVNLHWRAFRYSRADERDLWTNSVPVAIGAVSTRAMAPADQIFHVCVDGLEWNQESPVRWVLDSLAVLRSANGDVDWDRLCSLAAHHRSSHFTAEMLAYLRVTFAPEIPASVVSRLKAIPASRAELNLHAARAARPQRLRRSFRIHWAAYRSLNALDAEGARRLSFAAFAAHKLWGRVRARTVIAALSRPGGGA